MPQTSANKAAHSGFETQRRCHHKSKTGVSVAPQKGLMSTNNFFLKKVSEFMQKTGLHNLTIQVQNAESNVIN